MREIEWQFKNISLKELFEINSTIQLFWIALDWLMIAVTIAFSQYLFNSYSAAVGAPVYLISIIIIASRQHALLVIAHDCAHFRISDRKFLNDFIGNVFCSFPGLIGVNAYRTHHLNHHRHLNSDQDPDWARKIHLQEWQFPMNSQKLSKILISQLYRGGLEWLRLTYLINKINSAKKNFFQKENFGVATLWISATAVFVINGWTLLFCFYWIVPLLLVMPLMQRFRSITEHFSLPGETQFSSSRLTTANFVEEFLIAPHAVNYHLVHHLFPAIPHYKIKKAHGLFMNDPIYSQYVHINNGFFAPNPNSTWSELTATSDIPFSKVI